MHCECYIGIHMFRTEVHVPWIISLAEAECSEGKVKK